MLQLLKKRSFFLYLLNHSVSSVGLGIHLFVLSWLVLDLTESTASLGWLLSISSLPAILLSPFIGVFVDNWDRRYIVVFIQLVKGLLFLSIPFLFASGSLSIYVLYGISFLAAIAERLYFPASKGLMREILTKEELLSANSMASVAMQIGMMIGSAVAGFLIFQIGGPYTIMVNAFLAFASSFIVFFIRKGFILPKNEVGKKYESFVGEIKDGLTYLKQNIIILRLAILVALTEFTIQIYNILSVPFVRNEMNMGPEILGLLDTFFAWGAIVGGLTLTAIVNWIGRKNFMSIGLLLMGGTFAIIPFMQGLGSGAVIFFVFGISLLQARTLYSTTIHENVEQHYQGRVNSFIYTMTSIFGFFIYALVGYIGEAVTAKELFHTVGLLIVGISVLVYFLSSKILKINEGVAERVDTIAN
ncbi:MFS transporter [Brevibacillus sp. SYSU BS000544]|uniref:MFS transporter n=1 Tax=Brevibacillus sp. SYSU BS000544 TaxID=3416443 RepID=UPI003CE4D4F6